MVRSIQTKNNPIPPIKLINHNIANIFLIFGRKITPRSKPIFINAINPKNIKLIKSTMSM